MTTEIYERAALLISRAKSRVNVPDQHHAGMRIIGFKIDPDEWNGDLCLSYPLDCLANVAFAVNNIERLTSENEALRLKGRALVNAIVDAHSITDRKLDQAFTDFVAALSKKGEAK